jgi:hypothetical protein
LIIDHNGEPKLEACDANCDHLKHRIEKMIDSGGRGLTFIGIGGKLIMKPFPSAL